MAAFVPTTTPTVVAVANPYRKGLAIDNSEGAATLWVAYGAAATVSSSLFTYQINPGEVWKPRLRTGSSYVGVVSAVWSANGGAPTQITELI